MKKKEMGTQKAGEVCEVKAKNTIYKLPASADCCFETNATCKLCRLVKAPETHSSPLKAHTNFPVEVTCSGGCRLQAYRNEEQCHVACDLGGTNITAPFGEDEEKLQLTPQCRSRRSRGSESPLRTFCFVGVSILFCREFGGTWTVFGQGG